MMHSLLLLLLHLGSISVCHCYWLSLVNLNSFSNLVLSLFAFYNYRLNRLIKRLVGVVSGHEICVCWGQSLNFPIESWYFFQSVHLETFVCTHGRNQRRRGTNTRGSMWDLGPTAMAILRSSLCGFPCSRRSHGKLSLAVTLGALCLPLCLSMCIPRLSPVPISDLFWKFVSPIFEPTDILGGLHS